MNACRGARSLAPRLLERHRDDAAWATSPRRIPTRIECAGDDAMGRFLTVARDLHARLSTALGDAGLEYADYRILARLGAAGAPVDVTALADAGDGSTAGAEHRVERLAARGLIVLERPDPARSLASASLTAAGIAAAAAGAAAVEHVAAHFDDALAPPERERLGELIARVRSLGAAPPPAAER
ncbi:MAG: hypothetical protein IRZ00_11485 [Gemmatimonadetes bacterium]|nr:hypothetical protein [Gemmatimonadota bacterium]